MQKILESHAQSAQPQEAQLGTAAMLLHHQRKFTHLISS
jgi:hypothetical protein